MQTISVLNLMLSLRGPGILSGEIPSGGILSGGIMSWIRLGIWVGLGHESISSPGSGLGWVGSVCLWVGLGRGL